MAALSDDELYFVEVGMVVHMAAYMPALRRHDTLPFYYIMEYSEASSSLIKLDAKLI